MFGSTSEIRTSTDEKSETKIADCKPYDPVEEAMKREKEFNILLDQVNVDLAELRNLAWKGISASCRAKSWMIMIGYVPTARSRREETLERKRWEYKSIVRQHFDIERLKTEHDPIYKQISIDIPRTCPDQALFKDEKVKLSLTRILYCWSVRRPASGYVQGINDLVTPFYDVFLADRISRDSPDEVDFDSLEADCFWCFSKLVDSIQDNYTSGQTGIFRQLSRMSELVARTDPALVAHLSGEGLDFAQFAFRWMNCLLMREFPLSMIIRMWDTYLAEGDGGFTDFHTYVCAAFLAKWSVQLQTLDFGEMLLLLQNPPTSTWSLIDLEVLLSEAYVWKSLFHDAKLK